jgi:hypothetical protein
MAYICINVGDPVEGGVGMPLTGSLLFVYICIDVGDPVERRVGMPLTGSLMFVYICIGVSDPVDGRCWYAINRLSNVFLYMY